MLKEGNLVVANYHEVEASTNRLISGFGHEWLG